MRYIKALVIAVFFFLALIFFFQNQAPLSQEMQLNLNLLFIPPMKSIPLPFYFLVIAAFAIGCLFVWLLLIWDRFMISSKLMKKKWEVTSLKSQVEKLQKIIDAQKAQETKALPASTGAVEDEMGHTSTAIKS